MCNNPCNICGDFDECTLENKQIYKTDFSATDGLYYMVSEENNKAFLETLIPERKGEKTDLKGFFNRELEIVGKEKNRCTIFFIGTTKDLFGKTYYYEPVLILNEKRIYITYKPSCGRDHNYINNRWK